MLCTISVWIFSFSAYFGWTQYFTVHSVTTSYNINVTLVNFCFIWWWWYEVETRSYWAVVAQSTKNTHEVESFLNPIPVILDGNSHWVGVQLEWVLMSLHVHWSNWISLHLINFCKCKVCALPCVFTQKFNDMYSQFMRFGTFTLKCYLRLCAYTVYISVH
jgi:hypothetical protein